MSIRASAFDGGGGEQAAAAMEEWQTPQDGGLSEIIGEKVSEQTRPELTGARIVVSGGRGIGSAENFSILESLATNSARHLAHRFGCRISAIFKSDKPAR